MNVILRGAQFNFALAAGNAAANVSVYLDPEGAGGGVLTYSSYLQPANSTKLYVVTGNTPTQDIVAVDNHQITIPDNVLLKPGGHILIDRTPANLGEGNFSSANLTLEAFLV
jgi:hypothetical protein